MPEHDKHEGWTNFETWDVQLWMSNEPSMHRYWRKQAREVWDVTEVNAGAVPTRYERAVNTFASEIKDAHEEGASASLLGGGLYADLLAAALSKVNWDEIAKNFLSGLEAS